MTNSAKYWNQLLYREGLGTKRGLFMETPIGRKPDGSVKFQWGKKIQYCGSFRGRTMLVIAYENWCLGGCQLGNPLGGYLKRCGVCHVAFASTRSDALTCSAKCRKRASRKVVTLKTT